MERTPVHSSNLVSVGYDKETMILEIEFRGNRIYQYEQVPPAVYHGLITAPSAGTYFARSVRSVFPYKMIVESAPDAQT